MKEGVIKIIIIEDNRQFRESLAILLNGMEKYSVVGTYEQCEDALENIKSNQPSIVLIDLDLPGMHGIEGIRRIKKLLPEVDIMVITINQNSDMVFKALSAGAVGYICKDSDYSKFIRSIEEVTAGGAPMSSNIARLVVDSFQSKYKSPLSTRETQVLVHLADGKTYNQIADILYIHMETVKSHIKNIYSKLQVNNKADAIVKAMKSKII